MRPPAATLALATPMLVVLPRGVPHQVSSAEPLAVSRTPGPAASPPKPRCEDSKDFCHDPSVFSPSEDCCNLWASCLATCGCCDPDPQPPCYSNISNSEEVTFIVNDEKTKQAPAEPTPMPTPVCKDAADFCKDDLPMSYCDDFAFQCRKTCGCCGSDPPQSCGFTPAPEPTPAATPAPERTPAEPTPMPTPVCKDAADFCKDDLPMSYCDDFAFQCWKTCGCCGSDPPQSCGFTPAPEPTPAEPPSMHFNGQQIGSYSVVSDAFNHMMV